MHLPRREEPFRDATLIEHLDGAGVKTPGSRSVDILVGASFDDDDVDPRQRQLARQHQPGRTASCDHHRVFGHRDAPTWRMTYRPLAAECDHVHNSFHPEVPQPVGPRRAWSAHSGSLPQAPSLALLANGGEDLRSTMRAKLIGAPSVPLGKTLCSAYPASDGRNDVDRVPSRRDEIIELARAHGASRVRVFGSVAHGDATAASDIDFLVDLEPDRNLLDLGGLLMDLQDLLERDVDVVTEPDSGRELLNASSPTPSNCEGRPRPPPRHARDVRSADRARVGPEQAR